MQKKVSVTTLTTITQQQQLNKTKNNTHKMNNKKQRNNLEVYQHQRTMAQQQWHQRQKSNGTSANTAMAPAPTLQWRNNDGISAWKQLSCTNNKVKHQKKQQCQQQHQQQRRRQWLNNNNNKTTKMKMKATITITPTKSTTEKALKNEDVRLTADQAASCMQSSQQTHAKSATTTMMSLQHAVGPRGWQNGKTPAVYVLGPLPGM